MNDIICVVGQNRWLYIQHEQDHCDILFYMTYLALFSQSQDKVDR